MFTKRLLVYMAIAFVATIIFIPHLLHSSKTLTVRADKVLSVCNKVLSKSTTIVLMIAVFIIAIAPS